MFRLLDFLLSLLGLVFLSPLFILIWVVGWFVNGSPLYKQLRVGQNQQPFILIKFRTMPKGTKSVATHLIKNIKFNSFSLLLRKTKLDEIPQLWNVLRGDMSFVGPRPCLFNQRKLIQERKKRGIFKTRPGITGLGQIKNVTMDKPTLLAKTEYNMLKKMNIVNYLYYILLTLVNFFKKKE